ncbi:MAG TPA: DinB family protein, partial [Thermoanaerobaculia bacterium]|nr:DinB family protein [Thermoanaerobaculia bacterium]
APGKWSIKEIIAHLADGEVILGSRYRFIAAHDRPTIQGYDQDAFAARLGPLNAKAADLIDDFAMVRAANLGLLERLPEEAWDRVGLHSERGEESIRKLVYMYAGHDRHHVAQIETIRTGLFPEAGRRTGKSAKKAKRPARRRPR